MSLIKYISNMVTNTEKKLPVMLSDATDPYLPMERRRGITKRCVEVLAENGFPLLIVTKSDLVARDMNIFRRTPTVVSITTTTPTENIAGLIESYASPPPMRFSALDLRREYSDCSEDRPDNSDLEL